MWKPLVAVFVVAAIGTVALTNLDRFFPTDDMSRPTCDAASHAAPASSCCSEMASMSCCEISADEVASIAVFSVTEKDAKALLGGSVLAAK